MGQKGRNGTKAQKERAAAAKGGGGGARVGITDAANASHPSSPAGRWRPCSCSCELLKMASVCCGVCRECGRRSKTCSCAVSAETAASTEPT